MTQNRKKVIDAIAYFEGMGFIKDLTSDKRHYAQILLDYAKENMDIHRDEVSEAKEILKKSGYQTDIMFNISDITDNYYCSEDIATTILEEAYDSIEKSIWEEIVYKCNHYEIQQKD